MCNCKRWNIKNNIKNEKYIQSKLDEMLDILLFYENSPEGVKFENRVKNKF